MPIQENSQLDDQIAFDGDVSFSGGQASNVRKNTIAEGAYSIGKNTDFDTFGNIVSRKGVAQLVGDVIDSVWGDITTTRENYNILWTSNFTGSVKSLLILIHAYNRKKLLQQSQIRLGHLTRLRLLVTLAGCLLWDFRFADGTSAAHLAQQQTPSVYFAQTLK